MFTSTWYGTYSFLPSFPPTFSPYFVSLSSLAPRAPDYLCYVLIAPSKSCNSDNSSLLLVRHPNHSWPIKIQKVSHKLRRQPEREQVRERERERDNQSSEWINIYWGLVDLLCSRPSAKLITFSVLFNLSKSSSICASRSVLHHLHLVCGRLTCMHCITICLTTDFWLDLANREYWPEIGGHRKTR